MAAESNTSSPKTHPARPPPSPPTHHANDSCTAFKNPWPSAAAQTWAELAAQKFPLAWPQPLAALRTHAKAKEVKVVKPDWGKAQLEEKGLQREKCVVGTWLGHAGVLVEMGIRGSGGGEGGGSTGGKGKKESLFMLFDPIFSDRAGPTQWIGPGRMKASPCQVGDLPGCDAVFISHNHYDHLDLGTVEAVSQRFPWCRYFVPLGNKIWFVQLGVAAELVVELDWWAEQEFEAEAFGGRAEPGEDDEVEETRLRVTCVPAQHNSGRAGMDAGSTLWCGWAVERFVGPKKGPEADDLSTTSRATRKGAIYHAGDTGYRGSAKSEILCPAFEQIGRKLGPFDLSFIPIWRGGSLGFISYMGLRLLHNDLPATLHCSPTDAVAIHQDVKSRNTVGIHFGTFVGSENETYEAMIEFGEACDDRGVRSLDDQVEGEQGRAGTLDIGGSLVVEVG
jgi:N-acyl-phosphatidylethanolamine-hydrolysing phospholipase D